MPAISSLLILVHLTICAVTGISSTNFMMFSQGISTLEMTPKSRRSALVLLILPCFFLMVASPTLVWMGYSTFLHSGRISSHLELQPGRVQSSFKGTTSASFKPGQELFLASLIIRMDFAASALVHSLWDLRNLILSRSPSGINVLVMLESKNFEK